MQSLVLLFFQSLILLCVRNQLLLFLKSLFGKTTACARPNRAYFILSVSAFNTQELVPGNLNLFFLHFSASAAIPNRSAVAVPCELHSFEFNLLTAKWRAFDKQLSWSCCLCFCLWTTGMDNNFISGRKECHELWRVVVPNGQRRQLQLVVTQSVWAQ